MSTSSEQQVTIECHQLTKTFAGRMGHKSQPVHAVYDVSLSTISGQIVGLIGPNGAGKTTLLALLAGLLIPTTGRMTICGHTPRSIGARRSLGYMPEFPSFLETYSARATLLYHAALRGLSRVESHREVSRLIQLLNISSFADRPCRGFSQGMKRRLALAIAIIGTPNVLLLDEPSNGLDPLGIIDLRDLLQQLRDAGVTILISSHRLSELEQLTSDFIFMHSGTIRPFVREQLAVATRLKIKIDSNSRGKAMGMLSSRDGFQCSDNELTLPINDENDVPELIAGLVAADVRIKSVTVSQDNVENLFIRFCQERMTPCVPKNC